MANDPVCKARAEAAQEFLIKKRKSNSKGKNKNKKKPTNAATLTQDIAAALKVGAETPAPAPPVVGNSVVPPVFQVPQGPAPFFNTPLPGTQSVADHSFAVSANYYGNAAAYTTGFFRPGPTAQSVPGFHQGQPYESPTQWNGTPPGEGGGPNQMFPAMVL